MMKYKAIKAVENCYPDNNEIEFCVDLACKTSILSYKDVYTFFALVQPVILQRKTELIDSFNYLKEKRSNGYATEYIAKEVLKTFSDNPPNNGELI